MLHECLPEREPEGRPCCCCFGVNRVARPADGAVGTNIRWGFNVNTAEINSPRGCELFLCSGKHYSTKSSQRNALNFAPLLRIGSRSGLSVDSPLRL